MRVSALADTVARPRTAVLSAIAIDFFDKKMISLLVNGLYKMNITEDSESYYCPTAI